MARGYLSRGAARSSLQPTALINEVFVRLIDRERIDGKNRAHFFGVAAKTRRGILVDHARKRHAAKRGGSAVTVTLCFDEAIEVARPKEELDVVDLDDPLRRLATLDPVRSELAELRFLGGLSIEETAVVLGVSTGTVKRSFDEGEKLAPARIEHRLRLRPRSSSSPSAGERDLVSRLGNLSSTSPSAPAPALETPKSKTPSEPAGRSLTRP